MHSQDVPLIQLAPMEGVLDWVMRELLSEVGGFDRMVTEFIRVTERLLPDHVFYKYCPEILQGGCTRNGTPVFVQLLGGKPEPLAENARRAVELGAPGVDLNFGCPAKTVNRHDGGATLLKHPDRLFHILKAVTAAADAPVTAKVRLGFDHKDFHKEIAQAVEEGGAHHVVVHARTKTEMYTKPAHWHYIKSMSEGRKIPFLANGEIWSVADYYSCVHASGISRVALGRGIVRNPNLANEIRGVKKEFDALEFINQLFVCSRTYRGDAYAISRFKQILRYQMDAGTGPQGQSQALPNPQIDIPNHTNAPECTDSFEPNNCTLTKNYFNEIKYFTKADQISDFLKEKALCPKSKYTPGASARTAFEPRIY